MMTARSARYSASRAIGIVSGVKASISKRYSTGPCACARRVRGDDFRRVGLTGFSGLCLLLSVVWAQQFRAFQHLQGNPGVLTSQVTRDGKDTRFGFVPLLSPRLRGMEGVASGEA